MAFNPSKSTTASAGSAHAAGKPRQYDVAVIGGGIVGKACALGLAQQGFDVVQIAPDLDQHTAKPSGDHWAERIYAISPGTRYLLQSLQVWDAIDHARLQVVRDMSIYGDRGEPGDRLHLSAFEAGVPQLAWIGESDLLEHTLEQACRFQSKLECVIGSLDNLFVEPDGALLRLDGTQSPVEIKANLVIAADGANSSLRSMLQIQTDEKSYEQRAVVSNFLCTNAHLETAFQWFLPGGDILAMLPLPGRQVSMVWSTSPENATRLLALDAGQWQSEFAMLHAGAIVHALGTLSPHSKPGSFPLRKIRAQRVIGPELMPKVILIGDAAHVIHPLAGQGLNLGLRDVAALLRILRERESFRTIADPVLLRRYERERHGDTSAILWVTDRLKQLFTSANPLQQKIRNWGMGLVNRSHLIKRHLIKEALGEVQ
jgi:ubiquinone biosynthesis UbiH/UbiF/VisC/COQ6 family hydroxylase